MSVLRLMAAVVALSTVVMAQALAVFTPPRLVRGDAPALAPGVVVGGGQVLIEGIVDRNGVLTRPTLLRSTPPFSQMVLDAIGKWRFTPARLARYDGVEETVDATVLIAALYRPPTVVNGPTLGEVPKDLVATSADAPYPVVMNTPVFPAQALQGAVVMFEISLDQTGLVKSASAIGPQSGFESVARDALLQWKFRSGSHRARSVPSTAYVIFGFSQPVLSSRVQ